MLTNIIESATGLSCEVDETGECAVVFAPRPFQDEPELFLFIEKRADKYLLTDDGEVMVHHGRCKAVVEEIAAVVHAHGLRFTNGVIELQCRREERGRAVKNYIATMSALAAREQEFHRMWWQSWQESRAPAAK